MKLNDIVCPIGRKSRKTKRRGRGDASGQGSTSGRGHKGQKARAGGFHKAGFEGGQMPLQRRLPKRGFHNIFRKEFAIINLDQLTEWPTTTEVTIATLCEKGIISNPKEGLKVLARGELKQALVIRAVAFSAAAKKKIETAGGRAEAERG